MYLIVTLQKLLNEWRTLPQIGLQQGHFSFFSFYSIIRKDLGPLSIIAIQENCIEFMSIVNKMKMGPHVTNRLYLVFEAES